jgi:hypothetical protein
MAKNYKVSKFKTIENSGDFGAAGNMVTQGQLTITPNSGYYVSASDFSCDVTNVQGITSVSFSNSLADIYSPKNNVIATFLFDAGWIVPSENVKLVLPINGSAHVLANQKKQSVSYSYEIIRDNSASPNYSLTVATQINTRNRASVRTSTDITHPTISGYKQTVMTGDVIPNLSEKSAWVYVLANSGHAFRSRPYLKINDKAKGIISKDLEWIEHSTTIQKYPKAYSVILRYKNNVDVIAEDGLSIELIASTVAIPATVGQRLITGVNVGSSIIKQEGETRNISINGTKDSECKITIVRESTQDSILSKVNCIVTDPVVGKIGAYLHKFKKTGIFNLKQRFPGSNVLLTKTTAASSSVNTITVANITGILERDKVIGPDTGSFRGSVGQIKDSDGVIVVSVNTSTNVVTLNKTVTIDDDKKVLFKRSDSYYINVEPHNEFLFEDQTTLSPSLPTNLFNSVGQKYLYKLSQNLDLVLTFSFSETLSATITLPSSIHKVGRANTKSLNISKSTLGKGGYFKMDVTFTKTHGSAFTAPTTPIFSNNGGTSHWTNSNSSTNGGTIVSMSNFQLVRKTVSSSNDTITMAIDVYVKKWGSSDVIMDFDLAQITTT